MRTGPASSPTPPWIIFGTALVYFALGSVLTAHFMQLKAAWADNHHVFRLRVHQAVPGRMPVLRNPKEMDATNFVNNILQPKLVYFVRRIQ